MAKIRSDLKGIVVIGGEKYRAGDSIPARIKVGEHILEPAKDEKAAKGAARPAKKTASETDSD